MKPEDKYTLIESPQEELEQLFKSYKDKQINLVTLEEKVKTLLDVSIKLAILYQPFLTKKYDEMESGGSPGDPPPVG